MKHIRFAVCGAGMRSSYLARDLIAKLPDVTICAVCDPYSDKAEALADAIQNASGYRPAAYSSHIDMFDTETPDAVLVATGWRQHIPVSIDAMTRGIAVACEVGAIYSEEECWKLVDTYEQTKTPFMLMENCCFGKDELLALSMARNQKFGEIVYCRGAYRHDLRESLSLSHLKRRYRLDEYIEKNCDNYPTHDLGPIAKLLDINRGNRMLSLSSRASKARGLSDYIARSDNQDIAYLNGKEIHQGDIVETLITCENGELISLKLDTTLPTFYSREFTVRGTRGFYEQQANIVFLDGENHEMDAAAYYQSNLNNAAQYYDTYLPGIWKEITQEMIASGHGGMDYFEFVAFCEALRSGNEMPIDVYDAAAWMSISYLTAQSIEQDGASVEIPDFTRGAYKTRPKKDVVAL